MEPQSSSPTFHWRYAEFDDSNFQIRGRTLFFFLVVASLIIFIILTYLYARWLCRPENSTVTTAAGASSQLTTHAPPPCQGLDRKRISMIPILLHRASSAGRETECSICLGVFQDGEKVKVLPDCSHCYHSECVDKWLINQSTCPLCRSSLQTETESLV